MGKQRALISIYMNPPDNGRQRVVREVEAVDHERLGSAMLGRLYWWIMLRRFEVMHKALAQQTFEGDQPLLRVHSSTYST